MSFDLLGQQFNRLRVIARAGTYRGERTWLCLCECGRQVTARGWNLRSGRLQSCSTGCSHVTHGMTKTREYAIWSAMHQRCGNPKSDSYAQYGARGITVCAEWRDFATFAQWAHANGYADDMTIDRIDSSKGYSPENCRWITKAENSRLGGLNRHKSKEL